MKTIGMHRSIVLALCTLVSCGTNDERGPSLPALADGGLFDADALTQVDVPILAIDASSDTGCRGALCPSLCDTGKTRLSGTVLDPAGKTPLYNVIVYVPSGPLRPIEDGARCDRCSGAVLGAPIAATLTDARGRFVLEGVPDGDNVPLVVQVGKWRREVVIPKVTACQDNEVSDTNLTRLPRTRAEGSIPRIAVSTGAADPLECLLRKVGLADSEFGVEGSSARVHLFAGGGYEQDGKSVDATSVFASDAGAFPSANDLFADQTRLQSYDVLLLACEGAPNDAAKSAARQGALTGYLDRGGRVFASHYHDGWFKLASEPLRGVASWTDVFSVPPPPNPVDTEIVTSFPKGAALHEWLSLGAALTDAGKLSIYEAKHNVDAVNADAGATSWIYAKNPNALDDAGAPRTAIQYMTFNTPVGASADSQCGRVVYSDLHVSSPKRAGDRTGVPFPGGCVTTDLSPQEKALVFMLFDLSGCILKDEDPPPPPK